MSKITFEIKPFNPSTVIPFSSSMPMDSLSLTNQHSKKTDNSRPLDVHRWSDHSKVNNFVYNLWDTEFSQEFPSSGKGRKLRKERKYQFKVLMLDLYVAWKQDPTLKIGVGMSNSFYDANSRYNKLHISSVMIKLVKAVHRHGYIDKTVGNEVSKQTTRIWPTPKLIKLFTEAELSGIDIGISDQIEMVVLNEKGKDDLKAAPIEYDDDDYQQIPVMRQDVQKYNALLRNTFIDIGTLESPVIENLKFDANTKTVRPHKVRITQDNKLVKRIFYRGSWELGGRFHGGWWQQINSNYRKAILINDNRTVEVDYSGLHISLIYCIERESPPADPYKLDLLLDGYDAAEQRKVIKGLVLCAINAKSLTAAYQAFRNGQTKGSREKKLTNNKLEALLDKFIQQNPAVAGHIGRDKGVELMRFDGDITANIINHFTGLDIPILTVHDSYIIQHDKVDELITVMAQSVSEVMGAYKIRVTHDVMSNIIIHSSGEPELMNRHYYLQNMTTIPKQVKCSGYKKRRNRFVSGMNNNN